jgi:hypothetical protein
LLHTSQTDIDPRTRLPDALTSGPSGAFDDVATWTGSVVHGLGERWRMFYTGASAGRRGLVQRIGSGHRRPVRTSAGRPGGGGVWAAAGESVLGPFDVARAVPLTDSSIYSGRLIRDRAGQWVLLGFENLNASGRFVGALSDPMPVGWTPDGRLAVLNSALRDPS